MFLCYRSSLQNESSQSYSSNPNGLTVDGYYQFKTYIDSNGISTSEQRRASGNKMRQAINENPSASSTVPNNKPLKDKGIYEFSQSSYLRNNHSIISKTFEYDFPFHKRYLLDFVVDVHTVVQEEATATLSFPEEYESDDGLNMSRERNDKEPLSEQQDLEKSKVVDKSTMDRSTEVESWIEVHENQINGNSFTLGICIRV